jgi:hypothetical protein
MDVDRLAGGCCSARVGVCSAALRMVRASQAVEPSQCTSILLNACRVCATSAEVVSSLHSSLFSCHCRCCGSTTPHVTSHMHTSAGTCSTCKLACMPLTLRVAALPPLQVLWLNNPARDKSHAHLSRHLQHLLNMYPGRLGPMAVNLMHIVSLGDPLSPECIALAGSLQRSAQRYGCKLVGLVAMLLNILQVLG